MRAPSAAVSGTFQIGGELPVHRLGYGTMRLVGDGAWGEPRDPDEARGVLRRAVELGVTLIDTADAYGPEIAERLISEALYPYPSGLVIATKGGITRQGPAKTEYVGRAGYLIQCVEMSLRRLKLERIDLYQLHRIDAGTRKDPPYRPERSHAGTDRRGAEDRSNRYGSESLFACRPSSRRNAELVRTAGDRFPSVVSDGGWKTAQIGQFVGASA
jgi:aryl-alcohol dehydrogenase-like predicted oxidoreductase